MIKAKTKKSRITGYLRVSTDKKDLANQEFTVLKLANEKGWKWVDFVEETVSGTVSYKDRKLGLLLNELNKGDVLKLGIQENINDARKYKHSRNFRDTKRLFRKRY